ncbi:MAG TPA: hypothetical protein VGY97_07820 [Solirubrobacteraceae bacterium]|nr:hypothetical protein [Solirubrobacteraceae bacterium]
MNAATGGEGADAPEGPADGEGPFLESLTDTRLYSIGAYFCDQHPDLIDDVIAQSEAIEQTGLERYAQAEGMSLEACFQTLMTGLAVRYYKAVAGQQP